MMQLIGLILTGICAGFLSGLLGIGGGVIFVPALVFILGISIHQAIGISLAVIIPTALSGMLKHYSEGNVDLKIALILVAFAVLGSWLGATSATHLPAATLKKVFAVFLIFIGLNMLFNWTGNLSKKYADSGTAGQLVER